MNTFEGEEDDFSAEMQKSAVRERECFLQSQDFDLKVLVAKVCERLVSNGDLEFGQAVFLHLKLGEVGRQIRELVVVDDLDGPFAKERLVCEPRFELHETFEPRKGAERYRGPKSM